MNIRDLFRPAAGRGIGRAIDDDFALWVKANPPVRTKIDPLVAADIAYMRKQWEDTMRGRHPPKPPKDRVQRLAEAVGELTKIVVDLNKKVNELDSKKR